MLVDAEARTPQAKLGRRLKKIRENCNLKQEEVAIAMNWGQSTVSDLENGKRKLDALEVPKLASIYKIAVEEMLGGDRS